MKNLRSLTPYILHYKWQYISGFLFIVAANFLTIFALRYISNSFDELKEFFEQGNLSRELANTQLIQYAIWYIALIVLSGIFRFYQRQTIIVSSRKIEYNLRKNIFNHYTRLPISFYKKNRIGDLMNRITEDVGNVRMYVGPGIMYLINLCSLFIIISSFMFYYDWILALVALLPLPILSFLIYKVTRTIYLKSIVVQENQSAVSSFVQDAFSGIRVIKSFAKENFIYHNYDELTEKYKESNLSLALTNALFFPSVTFIIGLSYILIIYSGGLRYLQGHITYGNIVLFFMYVNYLVWPFISLGWIVSLLQKAEASMERINQFLDTPTEATENIEKISIVQGNIVFENVSYTYPNTGIQALNNVSFTIPHNQTLALYGKTGSGKTTIALLLLGLIKPDTGKITINGKNIQDVDLLSLRESIGYIPQEAFLFSDTIFNNIGYAKEHSSKKSVENVAKKSDIHKNILGFKNQYQTIVGERGVTLSGGQKQKVSIARALLKKAPILIFDDSLSAVDTETEETILTNIEQDFDNNTSLIISHRVSTAKNTDTIMVLDKGKCIEYGTLENLLENKKEFYELYNKQILEKELDN